jgi:hypothetical protein
MDKHFITLSSSNWSFQPPMGNELSQEAKDCLGRVPHPLGVKAVETWFEWSIAVVPRFSKLYVLNRSPIVYICTRTNSIRYSETRSDYLADIRECRRLRGYVAHGTISDTQYMWFKYQIPLKSVELWQKFTEEHPDLCVDKVIFD